MSNTSKLMEGKKGIVFGISNDKGIAYAISKELHNAGAKLAFNYLPVMEKRIKEAAEEFNAEIVLPGNVQDDESMDKFFKEVEEKWGEIDFMLHAVAFSDKTELRGEYKNTTRANFLNTMDISCFSYTDLANRAAKLMKKGGACLTLTYFGGEKFIPHYNVMGVAKAALDCSVKYLASDLGKHNIRVNALSAGPLRTLAAAGIGDFHLMQNWNELNAPLRRAVTLEDVGRAGLYLLSDMSSGVTGEIHHVDCGYNSMGMMNAEQIEPIADLLNKIVESKKTNKE